MGTYAGSQAHKKKEIPSFCHLPNHKPSVLLFFWIFSFGCVDPKRIKFWLESFLFTRSNVLGKPFQSFQLNLKQSPTKWSTTQTQISNIQSTAVKIPTMGQIFYLGQICIWMQISSCGYGGCPVLQCAINTGSISVMTKALDKISDIVQRHK